MQIKVEFSEASLFGNADIDDIDTEKSAVQFSQALENHLYSEYPEAEIEITNGIDDSHRVILADGYQDDREAELIGEIINKVWDGDDWLVGK